MFDASRLPITSVCVLKTKSDEKFIYVGSLDATMTIYNYTSKKLVSTVNLDERVQCMEISWGYVFLGSDRGYLIRYNISVRSHRFVVDSPSDLFCCRTAK